VITAPNKPEVLDVVLGENWANVSWQRTSAKIDLNPASEYYVEYRKDPSSELRFFSYISVKMLRIRPPK
jgi:hypothetical protein